VRDLRTRVVGHPSFMTPALVEDAVRRAAGDASVTALDVRWRSNERALDLLRRLPADGLRPGEITLDRDSEAWMALTAALEPPATDAGETPRAAFHVTLVPAPLIERVFRSVVAGGADQIPGYASVTLRLGNRVWHAVEAPPAGDRPVELASAAGRFELPLLVPSDAVSTFAAYLIRIAPQALPSAPMLQDGPVQLTAPSSSHAFTIGVDLDAPDALYASYRRRFWLAMGLILAATVAAFGGLASTWQAFQRQRRLSEMKSNFVSSVSHELRAPIAAVRLMTESLERGTIEDGARQREYLRAIVQECRRLSSLVENVLDFSRIDQGRSRYTFEPADLRALVTQTVELMQPYAAQRQIGLVLVASPQDGNEALLRRVDRQALQQALVNLIDNAIKHSPTGAEVTVGIEAGPDERHDGGEAGPRARAGVSLFVEDHGPGIPADEQERIFEPFYRRGSELRRETRGIGIGLSIVKHVAEAHGGRVVVLSSPGTGSRFTIELPSTMESES
jgi:signal transduction histidine kinase